MKAHLFNLIFNNKMKEPQKKLSLLQKIDSLDRKLSGLLHNCVVRPRFLELTIFPFAFLFQPYMFICLIAAVGVAMPIIEEHQRILLNKEGTMFEGYETYLQKPANIMLQYITQVLILLVVVLVSKRLFGRVRPSIPVDSKRMINLRSLENNCSMPSGDAAQGSLFAFFILYNFPYLYTALGGWSFAAKFITMVSIGRVFHHCHFIGDTIIGSFAGFLIPFAFNYFDLQVPVP